MREPSRLNDHDAAYLRKLRHQTLDVLRSALRGQDEVAVLGLPAHRNLGDSLIAAGTRAYLRELDVRVRYVCSHSTYDEAVLARLPATMPVLFLGGGNLGDLYPTEEEFRHQVITSAPHRRFILLPQTIHFADPANIDRSAVAYAEASNLTILVRDTASQTIAEEGFGSAEVVWSPDHALGWTPRLSRGRADELVVIARVDDESREADRLPDLPDWSFTRANQAVWWVTRAALRGIRTRGRYGRSAVPVVVARSLTNIRAAEAIASRARALATNRLHAHVLALLSGVPHAVTDNTYGKVSSIFAEYTGEFSTARWTDSLQEAIDHVS